MRESNGKQSRFGFKDRRGINEVARSRIIRDEEEVKHILDRQGCTSARR